jgi:hypothetical protein
VLDVRNSLFEQLSDVIVVEVVDNLTTIGPTDHEAEVTEHPQLVRDR